MANNRMVLLCNYCKPRDEWTYDDNDESGLLYLAKWYPSGSWFGEPAGDGAYYTNMDDLEEWGKRFFKFLKMHQHMEAASAGYTVGAGQPNSVRIAYETVELPFIPEIDAQKPS